MTEKKVLSDWCKELDMHYEISKKRREKFEIGEKKNGYWYLTKKEAMQIKDSLKVKKWQHAIQIN